jgi:ATP-dependent Clp protease protease subunit
MSGLPFVDEELLGRRVVRLWGTLDDRAANQICAEMMALDASGDGPINLYLSSTGGPLHAALAVSDTVDLLGVPVHVTCLGRVEGAALGVLAAGTVRVAAPHASFYLREPEVETSGNAAQMKAWADHHQAQLERFVALIARATGRPAEHVEADFAIGRWLSAGEALAYGLVGALLEK